MNEAETYPGMFAAEKTGLECLKETQTIAVPTVYSFGKIKSTAYLLLEHIPTGKPHPRFWEIFAENLAELHKNPNAYFGFPMPNYIGSLPQSNTKTTSAAEFYIDQRLEPQFKLAAKSGFPFKNLETVYVNISKEIPEEGPSLIHGDLWNGNYLVDAKGLPCLIDPAVCFASREMDLAMMHLFGGFPKEVFSVYAEIFPLEPHFKKRAQIWQLYYLLVHLNIFGNSYLPQVKSILQFYV